MAQRFHLVGLNCRFTHSTLSLFYLRHCLESNLPGCAVEISQFTINDPYYDTLLRLSTGRADALFFSVYIWNSGYVERLARDLALLDPELPLVLGGPQAPYVDGGGTCTVVEGPVEGLGAEFYRDLEAGRPAPVYRAEPVSGFPYPYREEDFSLLLRNRSIYYESSRGCPFRCSYCLSARDTRVARKDVATVAEELERLTAFDPKIVRFVDRTFNDDPERAAALWRFLARKPGRTVFHFEIAPDRFTEEMFASLEEVESGRFRFEIGIQSTDPETLAAVDRRMDVERALETVRRLALLDTIHLHVDLILGLPGQTAGSFRASFNRVFAAMPHYIQMGLLKVLPDTRLRERAAEHGLVFRAAPPYEILATRRLDHPTLARLHRFGECVETFFNNRWFRTLWDYLNGREEPWAFFDRLLETCENEGFFDLSPTQELLARMVWQLAQAREDRDLLLDILRHDWLRCGHRFLPDFLEAEPLAGTRACLRRELPVALPGLYDARTRAEFLKQGVFLRFSGPALAVIGLGEGNEPGTVCYLPEQTGGVLRHQRCVLVRTEP
ncbi:MAG: B12-binding domain-containing radical SAM protein [Desulfobulbaceae bacterium]